MFSEPQILETQRQVKHELDEKFPTTKPKDRLQYCSDQLANLLTSSKEQDRLKSYVYIMSILVLHARVESLSAAEVRKFYRDGLNILRMAGLTTKRPHRAGLFSDLYSVMSQIISREGEFWESLWFQRMGLELLGKGPADLRANMLLGMALRCTRVGLLEDAEKYLGAALELEERPAEQKRIALSRARIRRMQGQLDSARRDLEELANRPDLSDRLKLETDWELSLIKSLVESKWDGHIALIAKRGTHFSAVYVCEGRLIALALKTDQIRKKMTKISTLRSDPVLKPHKAGAVFDLLEKLERLHDEDVPLPMRMTDAGDIVQRLRELQSREQEILVSSALCRWLANVRQIDFMSIVVARLKSGDALQPKLLMPLIADLF